MSVNLEIYINGYIGEMFDLFGDGSNSYSLKNLNETLAANPNYKEITVHINSGGGLVSEGFAIHDKLRSLNVKVTTIVEGMCGSIATVIAQAGTKGYRLMFQNSEYFIHNPLYVPQGGEALNADYLDKLTGELRKSESKLVDFYTTVTGADRAILADKMKAETTLTSAEAKELGFIDEVINTNVQAMVRYKIAAAVSNPKQKTDMDNNEIKSGFARIEQLIASIFKGKKVNVKTSEGVDVYYSGDLGMGTKIYIDPEMTQPAPDGVHTIDGKVFMVTGGEVTKVEDATAAAPTAEQVALAKVAELETQNATLKTELQNANAEKETMVAAIGTIKTEFTNFKNQVQTGLGQDFTTPPVDKNGNQLAAKGDWKKQLADKKRAETEANKK